MRAKDRRPLVSLLVAITLMAAIGACSKSFDPAPPPPPQGKLALVLPDLETATCNSVALPLTVQNFQEVSGVQIYIAYDASHVTFDSASSSVMTDMTVNAASGVISLVWADMSLAAPLSLEDGDTLALFHFSNLTDPSALTFQSQTKVVDADAAYFTIEKTNGSMTCTGK